MRINFKNFNVLALAAMVTSGLGVLVAGPMASAATITVSAGSSIQAAINDAQPGDVLEIAAGTYNENLVVNKSLTLRGAQADVDARSRSGAETVLAIPAGQTVGITVQASDVTITGLTIDGTAATNPVGIMTGGVNRQNIHVTHNVITKTRVGISAPTGTDVTGFRAQYNFFKDNDNTTNGSGAGLYLGNVIATDVEISNNAFRNTDDGNTGSTNAILVSGQNAGDVNGLRILSNTSTNDGSFVYTFNTHNVTIANNTVSNERGHGVLVSYGVNGLTIEGNTFSNSTSGIRLATASNIPDTGRITNVVIRNNTITAMTLAGVSIVPDAITGSVVMNGNVITGMSVGVNNESSVTINADNNYWGCGEGPAASGCASVQGAVVANIWFVDQALTTTNVSSATPIVPGAPNAGVAQQQGMLSGALVVITALAAGAGLVYRRVSSRR